MELIFIWCLPGDPVEEEDDLLAVGRDVPGQLDDTLVLVVLGVDKAAEKKKKRKRTLINGISTQQQKSGPLSLSGPRGNAAALATKNFCRGCEIRKETAEQH